MLTNEEIKKLPKIDLHRHLDGDVTPKIILALAEKEKIQLPGQTEDQVRTYFRCLRENGLPHLFQDGFGLVTRLMQSEENLYTVAYEEVRNLAEDAIVYAEVRFAPQYHTGESQYYHHTGKNKLTYQEVIKAIGNGLDAGEKEFKVNVRMIICIGRETSPENGVAIAQAAARCIDEGVVAIDLACDEATYPPERHIPAYLTTLKTPLQRTVHAGEFGSSLERNIETAMYDLHADRIGHAIWLASYPVLEEVINKGIGIESSPLSNKYCGFTKSVADNKIPLLIKKGALVSVNSDDPAMFGYTLTETLCAMVKEEKLTRNDLKRLQLNAIETAFVSEGEKEYLRKLITTHYQSD